MSSSINSLRERVDKIKGQYRTAHDVLRSETQNLKNIEQRLLDIKEAQTITQAVAQTLQQQAHSKIADVVTRSLQTVFTDKNYEFKLKFERKRNKTEAKPILIKDGNEVEDPLNDDSGGVVDVAAFTLRLSALLLTKPAVRNLLVMDEPFKFVSVDYRDNVRQMLEKLSEDFDFQFLIVTHQRELMCGKAVNL